MSRSGAVLQDLAEDIGIIGKKSHCHNFCAIITGVNLRGTDIVPKRLGLDGHKKVLTQAKILPNAQQTQGLSVATKVTA